MTSTTPMMRQYLEIKDKHPDAILFFRMGDFYEMFLDDAVKASKLLDITLTARNRGERDEIPMCGVPFHSSQPYISKLVDNGFKVAICEQVEDPKKAKGLVRRDVVRVVTPGLNTDTEALNPKENNFLMSLANGSGENCGAAWLDFTTGEFQVAEFTSAERVRSEISSVRPGEILLPEGTEGDGLRTKLGGWIQNHLVSSLPDWVYERHNAENLLLDYFSCASLDAFGCAHLPDAVRAAGAVLHYLCDTQKGSVAHIRQPRTVQSNDHMVLDDATRRNLELVATLQGGTRKGSLLGELDRTQTAMGGRKLVKWLNYPLIDVAKISCRQEGIGEFVDKFQFRSDTRERLDGVSDLERLNAKISLGSANARDLLALRNSLARLPAFREPLLQAESAILKKIGDGIDILDDIHALIQQSIDDNPPFTLREGGLIREGFHAEIDGLRHISRDGKGWIARLEKQERERTGINSLKIRFNKVFGYYIEVTRTNLKQVPDDYHRKQTLANAERYITPALKEYEDKVLRADERMVELEYEVFQGIRTRIAAQGARIQATADALADLDVLTGLADVAHEYNYVRPEVDDSGDLIIRDGRHPVIENMNLGERFVPNDVAMDNRENQILIITGPNMAGKSTFMRQVALIVLMAQIGSFVPAGEARVGVVDRIFTRVGASDNLARGQSTFMVEMTETAHILNHATNRSLIVLDEIGRGTSTFDGISIAWSVVEFLHDSHQIAAKTLFATHYHELTDLALTCERVRNFNIAVKEWDDRIIFLRRIVQGGASHSYGIQVARLAGLPPAVIDRAKEVLANLEAGELSGEGEPKLAQRRKKSGRKKPDGQLALFSSHDDKLRKELENIDVSVLTPLEALNLLDQLKKMV
ncbi:MAG: DNA mismatch repair protein MutS [Deltaproteobacteria bacterium]|nr:DNA mismatch repair protein MutS [Deltaproteobacteria bacterium]